MTTEEVLEKCTVEDTVVKLPDVQLDRKLYLDVKKHLEGIGGKWKGGKVAGFVFPSDPSELLGRVQEGEKINLKKDYQFFATPPELADQLVEMLDFDPEHDILEPSAGDGALIEALNRKHPNTFVDCFEAMPNNQQILIGMQEALFMGEDFLKIDEQYLGSYDRVIANPPFTKNQDIDHVKLMYTCLKKGGRLVSITSAHWELSSNRKETEFREWLEEVGAEIHDIEQGAFKSSGTMVGGKILVINK